VTDGVVDGVIGHGAIKVLDEVLEVKVEPGIWGEDEGWSGLEEAFQVEMARVHVFCVLLFSKRCHLWYALIKSSA